MTLKSIHLKVKFGWPEDKKLGTEILLSTHFFINPAKHCPKNNIKPYKIKRQLVQAACHELYRCYDFPFVKSNQTNNNALLIIMMIEWLFCSILLRNIKKCIYVLTSSLNNPNYLLCMQHCWLVWTSHDIDMTSLKKITTTTDLIPKNIQRTLLPTKSVEYVDFYARFKPLFTKPY